MTTTTASPASMPPIKPSVEEFVPLPPILSVNDDVLREIIFRSMRADDDRYASRGVLGNLGFNVFSRAHELYKLIRICRRFRDVAYANPDFWADIVGFAASEKGFAYLLQRACNVPLTLVRSFERPLSKAQIEFSLNNLNRIAILGAHNSVDNDWTTTLSGQTMDSLVALSIDSKSVVNKDSSQISIPPLNAPHLHYLKLTGSFYIPVIAPQLHGLELSGTRTLMSPVELLDMLLSTPALQDLFLSGILPSAVTSRDQWDHCSGREVHLHCLEALDLRTDSCATVVTVLRHVKLPAKARVDIGFHTPGSNTDMLALAQLLQPHLSWPTYDSIRIGLRYNSGSFGLFTHGDGRQSPSVQLYLDDDVNFFEHVGQLSEFIIPHRITHLDVGSSCESRDGVSQALSLIAPSIQTLTITVHEGIALDFLTDEDSSLDFSSLREININWPERSAPAKGETHWNGLRSWIERVGAKQLETLHLEGTNHYIDQWGLGRVLETLKKHKSKCRLVDKRVIYGARINYEPASGRREKWDWST